MKKYHLSFFFALSAFLSYAQPEITSWILSDGATGQYYQVGGAIIDTGAEADVQMVQYSNDFVYISANGLPSYLIGPYQDGNPAQAGAQPYLFKIPRNPEMEAGMLVSPGLGHIGVLVNGVPIFNAEDAMTYNNQGIWHRNAVYFENDGFDCAKGHPAPNFQNISQGYYHHHQDPSAFSESLDPTSNVCDNYPSEGLYQLDATQHSPIIGFAFDGFPIYGAFGFENTDGTGGVTRIQSSYQFRAIADRTTLADGTVLMPNQYGPSISDAYPIGAYIEDYEYIDGSGHLDVHNGRWCVTPEYPGGTYAYFATIDENWNAAYPYFIGPTYYGIVLTENFGTPGPNNPPTNVTINEDVETWDGSTSLATLPSLELNLVPNPATEIITIAGLSGDFQLKIFDASGRLMLSIANQAVVNVSELPSGMYFVHLTMATGDVHSDQLMIIQ